MLLAEEIAIGSMIWEFANSPLGISIVSGVLLWILSLLWKSKPGWEKLFDQYRGLFFDAVKKAETAIPGDAESSAAKKADAALAFILKLEGPISKKKEADLKTAIAKAHETLEAKGKLKFISTITDSAP